MAYIIVSPTKLVVAFFLLGAFVSSSINARGQYGSPDNPQPADETENQNALYQVRLLRTVQAQPESAQLPSNGETLRTVLPAIDHALRDLHQALSIMQDEYFSLWLGKWTTAIDWTAAVTGTYVSAALSSFSRSSEYTMLGASGKNENIHIENEINGYFGQSTAFYYGEEAFAIRMQAYDDMLWVVLGWLESIQFVASHSSTHHAGLAGWHAQQFIPAFAHRARIFYELAEQGWDWRLCGGGMTWNPRLLPYKNAITNQLFISASIAMYLHYPGDENDSPFVSAQDVTNKCLKQSHESDCHESQLSKRGLYNPIFRQNAIHGYTWLRNSGMLNAQGLYTDGFHIRDYRWNKSATTCNERNEMVYTYNQGVVLSGLRGLWEATGNTTYLEDGHKLVSNVIRATGWNHKRPSAVDDYEWRGLGYRGVLIERCDPSGSCNQDGQTFKGIFFHHLTAFCNPLPRRAIKPGSTYSASKEVARLHKANCDGYTEWIVHNAKAALKTRDKKGRFGAWWGAAYESTEVRATDVPVDGSAVDYRNMPNLLVQLDIASEDHSFVGTERYDDAKTADSGDLNERGRGRTVETQGGGLSVVRAMLEFLRRGEDGEFDC